MPKQRHAKPVRQAAAKPAVKTPAKARPPAKAAKPAAKPSVKPVRSPAKPAPKVQEKAVKKPSATPKADGKRAQAAVGSKLPAVPAGPSPHQQAVDAFERGFHALQQRQFGKAAELLTHVVNDYPDEKELQERARVYLSICERQSSSQALNLRSVEERINAATVAINRGEFAAGLALLRKVEADHHDNDHVHYLLCVAHTVLGETPQAIEHLKKAIALNHENRYLAAQDADLDALRGDPGFLAALETPSAKPSRPAARRR